MYGFKTSEKCYPPYLGGLCMHPAFLVAMGGALGALGRWAIGSFSAGTAFPWATLGVNLVGSMLLGVLAAVFSNGTISRDTILLLGVGFLGAFTTMSTYSFEVIEMGESGAFGALAAYVVATALGCPLFALFGWRGMSLLMS
jgi:CrcB protein